MIAAESSAVRLLAGFGKVYFHSVDIQAILQKA